MSVLRPSSSFLYLAALLFLSGCGEITAIDIEPLPNPNVNSTEGLVAQIQSIRVKLDSGLYPTKQGLYPSATKRVEGNLTIEDLDGDGQGELWTTVDVAGLGRLPRIRVEQGDFPDMPLQVSLDGIARVGGKIIAQGGVNYLLFDQGETKLVMVDFNILATYLPPRVSSFWLDRSSVNSSFGSVLVEFSKLMNKPSLLKNGVFEVARLNGSAGEIVPLDNIIVYDVPPSATRASYSFKEGLKSGTYRVRVSTGAVDLSGCHLDQVPLQPENQGFESTFIVGQAAQLVCAPNCEQTWCERGGNACAPGLTCEKGACVPAACPASCSAAFVCNPSLKACVLDCRIYGSYGGCTQGSCQSDGLCR